MAIDAEIHLLILPRQDNRQSPGQKRFDLSGCQVPREASKPAATLTGTAVHGYRAPERPIRVVAFSLLGVSAKLSGGMAESIARHTANFKPMT